MFLQQDGYGQWWTDLDVRQGDALWEETVLVSAFRGRSSENRMCLSCGGQALMFAACFLTLGVSRSWVEGCLAPRILSAVLTAPQSVFVLFVGWVKPDQTCREPTEWLQIRTGSAAEMVVLRTSKVAAAATANLIYITIDLTLINGINQST